MLRKILVTSLTLAALTTTQVSTTQAATIAPSEQLEFSTSASEDTIQKDTSENLEESRGVPFQPDSCMVVKRILPGWDPGDSFTDVEVMGGGIYRLYDKNKVGFKSLKAGCQIEVMMGPNNQVYGWKVS